MASPHRIWAEIDCDAVRHNLRQLRLHLKPATKIMAVLKADAYGHGTSAMAEVLSDEGVDAIGVGNVDEGRELRDARITLPILVLGALIDDEISDAIQNNIQINIHSLEMAEKTNAAAKNLKKRAQIQLMLDTGMGRLGTTPHQLSHILRTLPKLKHLELVGMNTHLSSASESDPAFSENQIVIFQECVDLARSSGFEKIIAHAANHTTLMRFAYAHFDMVRPGLALYGLTGLKSGHSNLQPALTLKTQVVHVKDVKKGTPISYDRLWHAPKDTRIATLSVGYNDGYPISLTNNNEVLIRGRRADVVGRVSMDYIMVDVGHIAGIGRGDSVTLVGRDGDEEIRLEEVAARAGTIPYEITCSLGRRVRRVYVGRKIALPDAA